MRISSIISIISLLSLGCQSNLEGDTVSPVLEHDYPILEIDSALPPPVCPDGMTQFRKQSGEAWCLDKYEAPQVEEPTQYPYFAWTSIEANKYCQARDKRLPMLEELKTACKGPNNTRFPYSNQYDRNACNDHQIGWRKVDWIELNSSNWYNYGLSLVKGHQSHRWEFPKCCNSGVCNLIGNEAEIAIDPHSQYGVVGMGGYFFGALGGIPDCNFVNPAHPLQRFRDYEMGFRCAKSLNATQSSN